MTSGEPPPPSPDRRETGSLLRLVASHLVDAERGIDMVQAWIDDAKRSFGVDDVVLIVEGREIGRQAFRASGAPLRGGWASAVVRQSPAGVYTSPPLPLDRADVRLACRLSVVAIELDIARGRSMKDPLTGLHNRRGFEEVITQAIDRCRRYGWAFSLVLVDLDGFKSLNDTFGHAAGDAVLETVGDEVSRSLRRGDIAARVGGDEFALVLAGADTDALAALVSRLRSRLSDGAPFGPVDFSWGHASAPEDTTDIDELYLLADRRLYEDKGRSGRTPRGR